MEKQTVYRSQSLYMDFLKESVAYIKYRLNAEPSLEPNACIKQFMVENYDIGINSAFVKGPYEEEFMVRMVFKLQS